MSSNRIVDNCPRNNLHLITSLCKQERHVMSPSRQTIYTLSFCNKRTFISYLAQNTLN